MIRFGDRLWIAWRILRGELIEYRTDALTTAVTLTFTDRDRARLNRALDGRRKR